VASNAYIALYLRFALIKDYPLVIIATFALGAFLAIFALVAALHVAQRFVQRMPVWLMFCLAVSALCALTIGITAGLFALEYRNFYAQWHAPAFSRLWFFEQFFTLAGAYYQFAVLGLRLYLPATPFIVFLASIILTRRIS
jgi:hypothetical protein